jgi:hypothetical protein
MELYELPVNGGDINHADIRCCQSLPVVGLALHASLTSLYVTTYSGRVCRGSCVKLVRALTRQPVLVPDTHLVNVEVVSRLGQIPFVSEDKLRAATTSVASPKAHARFEYWVKYIDLPDDDDVF